ncbi:single-stranded-DNA-specific exonuclease RecJ [Candidatus Saccharibacteria bacterium]|nr:single-stranded-DNA-specific exonuclease RecJ [Candidatus Saccharibacteria bacterium]
MSSLFDELVRKRGFSEAYLKPKYEDLASPFLLPDMKKTIERIKKAKETGEKIIIYGDYDADGVTASTVMNEALKLAGITDIEMMLPDRFLDGYGMSKKVVQRAKEQGAKLVITVDCGSGNKEVVDELKAIGVETIVTDHHECPEELPKAVAVVNPKRKDAYKQVEDFEDKAEELVWLRDLAGVGVAFMVAKALTEEGMIPDGQEKWLLDLVLIGTICDSMAMTMENRILCFFGVKVLRKTRRAGLKELIRELGPKKLNSETIGFQIGPRINAAGRMANAEVALKLMMAKKKTEAARYARELEELNAERRKQQIMAMNELEENGVPSDKVLVLTGDWHEGVLGIIAGRIVEEYKRPAFVLSEKDGILKGSGRSFGEFNLAKALKACSEVIVGGGGHAGAAGVKIKKEELEKFREKVNEYYESLGLLEQERFFEREEDLEVEELSGLNSELLKELEGLEPFGPGNEEPVFKLKDVFVLEKGLMGEEGRHLKLIVRGSDEKTLKLVAFGADEEWKKVEQGGRADILVNIEENEWNGLINVEGRILDLREE